MSSYPLQKLLVPLLTLISPFPNLRARWKEYPGLLRARRSGSDGYNGMEAAYSHGQGVSSSFVPQRMTKRPPVLMSASTHTARDVQPPIYSDNQARRRAGPVRRNRETAVPLSPGSNLLSAFQRRVRISCLFTQVNNSGSSQRIFRP